MSPLEFPKPATIPAKASLRENRPESHSPMNMMTAISKKTDALNGLYGLAGSGNVRTPCGPRRVENVRKGDLIVTRDNGLQPVKMVFSRTVTKSDLAADPGLAPVRLRPRALGPMMPQQDLLVAPGHKVLVPGYRLADVPDTSARLISARDIADKSDTAFADRTVQEVTYYSIVFDQHEIFCVNGLPVESYLPCAETMGDLDKSVRGDLQALLKDQGDADGTIPASIYAMAEDADYRPEFV